MNNRRYCGIFCMHMRGFVRDFRRCIMRFVIGGADSGKRDFVRENYGIDEILMADYDSVLTAKAVYGFHIFIKKISGTKVILTTVPDTKIHNE